MRSSCIGKPCEPHTTCVQGTCVPSTIDDPSRCVGDGCDERTLGANDAGASDATMDTTLVDSSVDAGDAGDAPNDVSNDTTPAPDSGTNDATVCATCAASLALGTGASCATDTMGGVSCWGDNGSDQLGQGGSSAQRAAPLPVRLAGGARLTGVVGVISNHDAACARRDGGTTLCWGQNYALATLTDASIGSGQVPSATVVDSFTGAVEVAIGGEHFCWRTDATYIICNGDDPNGQLGAVDAGTVTTNLGVDTVQIAAGDVSTCVLNADKRVRCWGDNTYYESAPGNAAMIVPPTVVDLSALAEPIAVAVGANHVCAILVDRTVACWGGDGSGNTGQATQLAMPARVTTNGATPLGSITAIAVGHQHSCALDASGTVSCWGDNAYGQLGHTGSTQTNAQPVQGLGTVRSIAAGYEHSCALLLDGSVWCWGHNGFSQLGPATDAGFSSTPVRVF
jgi:alpha-tubulin suppressor-like RCC1 family protein